MMEMEQETGKTNIFLEPVIEIIKPIVETEKRIILPPSRCGLTLHQRFTKMLCPTLKREIDPGVEEIMIPRTLIGRLSRLREAARLAAQPYMKPSQKRAVEACMRMSGVRSGLAARLSSNNKKTSSTATPGSLDPSMDMYDDVIIEPHPIVPGEPLTVYARRVQMQVAKSTYSTGPFKSREELDAEIEAYFAAVGGRKRRNSLDDEISAQMQMSFSIKDRISMPSSDGSTTGEEVEEKKGLFNRFWKTLKSRGGIKLERDSLDDDLDNYFSSKPKNRQSLDDDLENYRNQDPRAQLKATMSSQNDRPSIVINEDFLESNSSMLIHEDFLDEDFDDL